MQDLERHRVEEMIGDGAQLVEVLGAEEFEKEHLPEAINIPLRKIENQAESLDKNAPVIVYCWDSA